MAVTRRPSKAHWDLSGYSALTITVSDAGADSARAIGALGLELSSLTPGVLRMTASAAALVSFEKSSGLLHELAGVEVSAQLARFRVHPHLEGAQGPKRAFLLTADSRQPPALPRLVFVEDGYGTSATAKPERMADPLVRRSPVEPIAR